MSNKTFVKLGSLSLIIGGFISFLGTVLHDRTLPAASGEERLHHIAMDSLWTELHFSVAIGTILSLIGFIALYQYWNQKGDAALARLATVFAIISSAFSLVLLSVDGFVMPRVAADWLQAAPADSHVSFLIAHAFEHLNLMMFSMFILLYFGVTFGLYGVAILSSRDFPRWLGWSAAITGVVAILVGSWQLLLGLTVLSTILFVVCWILVSMIQMVLGVMLYNKKI